MTKEISDDEVGNIQRALTDARKGRATLKQLAHAHDVAETHSNSHRLSATIGELRDHIRRMTPAPLAHAEAKSLLLGVISGVITWFILGRTKEAAK